MNYSFQYIDNNSILIRKFEGDINFAEIYDTWNFLIENHYLDKVTNGVLNDFRKASFKFELDELKKLMNLFQNNPQIFNRIKLAVIMEKPENFVFPVYAEIHYPEFKIKAFCTEEAALIWLQN